MSIERCHLQKEDPYKKMKNDASKTLGKWTKKHHDNLEIYKLDIGSTFNNLLVG
jgi:hypothetical protein